MIHAKLIAPDSIVVIGASNDIRKPGGKVLKNLIDNNYTGKLLAVNPKEHNVQGITAYPSVEELPNVDLAILAIPANFCLDAVKTLSYEKKTKAFIIFSAGFSEESENGAILEHQIVKIVEDVGGTLIGPNCIGIITPHHASVFTTPVPKIDPLGIDFISGSGATAVFIMETGIPKGLKFANVFSVGNSAQVGVEDVLEYLDITYENGKSAKIKLLYLENISNPTKLLKHATSLINKGCSIAAIKAGSSEAGIRAASSHTGAMATPDIAVDALLKKAGIIRCYSREELTTVASVLSYPKPKGKRVAIITHAGGPAVMLTDTLANNGIDIPSLKEHSAATDLLSKLYPGSSIANPIDFLATGNAQQLDSIIDACEHEFNQIDAMAVIFGSPGLFDVYDVYEVLLNKMNSCNKPIYPILPSAINAKKEIEFFISKGRVYFPDEVVFGNAFSKIINTAPPSQTSVSDLPSLDTFSIRQIIDTIKQDGYIDPPIINKLMNLARIPFVEEYVCSNVDEAIIAARNVGFPVVLKVIGPIHKSDVGGVSLNVKDEKTLINEFDRLTKIPQTTAILIQKMVSGIELFIGVKKEQSFGHIIMCGLGGIYVEVLKDVKVGLSPLKFDEAMQMILSLKSLPLLKGLRGKEGIDIEEFAHLITRISALVETAPEIDEMDINPLLAQSKQIIAVDVRLSIKKNKT